MSTTLADAELVDRPAVRKSMTRASVAFDGVANEDSAQMAPARGIVLAVLVAVPIWALIGTSVYLLL